MTHKHERVLSVAELARVEGEGALYVRTAATGRRGAAGHLRAAPLLRGVPARPRVHRAAGHHRPDLRHLPGRLPDERRARPSRTPAASPSTTPIADLRRLLYCGEWIESHALHIYLLHAPDFLGYRERDRDGAATTATSSNAAWR